MHACVCVARERMVVNVHGVHSCCLRVRVLWYLDSAAAAGGETSVCTARGKDHDARQLLWSTRGRTTDRRGAPRSVIDFIMLFCRNLNAVTVDDSPVPMV